jgi:uncharacterized repeat protein (TIGR02543 family)
MKTLKKTALIILALALSLACVLPVFANASQSNLTMSVSSTSVKVGDTVTVTIKLRGNPEVSILTGGFMFDKSVFECTSITNGSDGANFYLKDSEGEPIRAMTQSSVANANGNGKVGFTFSVNLNQNEAVSMRYSAIAVVKLKALKAGTCSFKLYEDTATIPANGAYAYKSDSAQSETVTVKNETVTISFDANGHGTAPKAIEVEKGKTATKPADPTATGYLFQGWFKEAACTNAFDWSKNVNESITLYAKWHKHTPVKTEAKAADCEHDGNIEYWSCSECGKYFSDKDGKTEIKKSATVTKALGHDWDAGVVTTEPTCDKEGVKTYTCKRCPETKTEKIKALGHDWTNPTYTWSSDNSKVTATAVCSRDALHKLTETVTATRTNSLTPCGQEGTATYKATFKNSVFTAQTKVVKIASVPHTLKHYDAEPVSCEDDGRIEYWYCTVCGKYFTDSAAKTEVKSDALVIEALGHDIQGPEWTWAEDLSKASVAYSCTRCDYKETAEAVITSEGDLRIATAEMVAEKLTDIKRVASDDMVGIASAKNSSGIAAWVAVMNHEAEKLTSENAAAVEHDELKDAKAEDITVVWQKHLKIADGSEQASVTLKVDDAGEGKEILAYRWDAENGWQLSGFAKNTDSITVSIEGEQEVAVAVRPVTEEKSVDPVKPVDPGKNVPDRNADAENSSMLKYIGIGLGAAVLAIVVLLIAKPRKGRHYN